MNFRNLLRKTKPTRWFDKFYLLNDEDKMYPDAQLTYHIKFDFDISSNLRRFNFEDDILYV